MPLAGQRVGEYILEERLGAGTFSEVWRASHQTWADQRVTIKIATDPKYLRRLHRDHVLHGLVHPNIVRVIGFEPDAQPPYLIYEHIPGMSLRPFIVERKLSPNDAIAILRQVLNGLKHAHAAGVVHRAIKPENILIHTRHAIDGFDGEGVVKITDFGLSEPPWRPGEASDDPRDNLSACGRLLYEMLTGELPKGTDRPSDLNKTIPRHLDEVFRRSCLKTDDGFESADEVLRALSPSSSPAAGVPQPLTACPRCRGRVDPGDQFCIHCGNQIVAQVLRCANCGGYPDPSDEFCGFCGEKVQDSAMAVGHK